jgi:hypothetical protein
VTEKMGQAEKLLTEELEDVTRQLAGVKELQENKARIEAALAALRPSTATTPGESYRPLTQARSLLLQPSTPSDAALGILLETPGALHIRQIIDALWARGWFKERQYESLRGTIVGTLNIKSKEPNGAVEKVAPSTYRIRPEMTQPDLALGGAGPG